ncbi:MerR family transcriptional regulator [Companilactobacillus paralimentarius DSM 13238 = JCM 10415]|jgi:Predicted transcriptional regulators|uniref:MerR family transcriptional regulator n=1 Tax=Companilactobacillus paralimentarius DSM 13238 = JCM 10415 TaxID=1122151 RepID=A0A0R1PG42_9LACO|nr:MerR family transcriptional regulator [Companilactobacillus paralimentarius]KAE9564572.1 MerR family transcriptional regulator [Companilactobacillus paralimentarius]KRL31071.1 MerR family transcriptional regulator [Companilactobacillus paralimentarius DSM 13238 = JCM 10415]MDR4932816.1 MerR family transcriptional regulator [Companilactobacillus paralimentarius]QFR69365.1 MerR family transcriptional regulator [Companilactobacillus paralimentarius]
MKYTIKKLAELAGVSTRTLRYYDQIGLLKPSEVNENNYRIYDEKNVNKLQQILFYRALDFPLNRIQKLINDPNFSRLQALKEQQLLLKSKRDELESLLTNIDATIKDFQGEEKMTDDEKFEAFKQTKISENEQRFGQEIRENYGKRVVDAANDKFVKLSEKKYQAMNNLEAELIQDLVELKKHPNLNSDLARKIFEEHKQWLKYTWSKYNEKMHRGLVNLYVEDERFTKYYDDKANTEVVKLLRDVIYKYTE